MQARTIFHVDMDAFFVSVEELFDPSLKGKPVVVGGLANERGVVSAASYAAREYGVRSAMPLRRAYQLCPQAVFLPGHPRCYREYSGKVHQVLKKFSPRIEMASIDEAYLEMTGTERLLGPPLKAGDRLHQAIADAIKLPCSIGIGTSRLVAKICSAMAKPNGMLRVMPGAEAAFLAPLDIRKIPGVGKVTERGFRERGVHKIGQLSDLGEDYLEKTWGQTGLAPGFLQVVFTEITELAYFVNASFSKASLGDFADAGNLADVERREESRFRPRHDTKHAVWLGHC